MFSKEAQEFAEQQGYPLPKDGSTSVESMVWSAGGIRRALMIAFDAGRRFETSRYCAAPITGDRFE
jgi:hypothetical protein